MTARTPIADISKALLELAEPTVVRWNRLEGRPRSRDFRRAMRAEVRDALWMLCRQWQLGEFEGEDAGSPVTARISIDAFPLTHYAPDSAGNGALTADEPLEPRAERMAIALDAGSQAIALDIRLALGRRWQTMLAADPELSGYRGAYIAKFPVDAPNLDSRDEGFVAAHHDAAQMFAAAAGRCLDGGKLLAHLRVKTASDGLPIVLPAHADALDALGPRLLSWYARVFEQPDAEDAWRADRMEYRFSVDAASRPDAARFVAEEHHSGRVEWHSFDVAAEAVAEPRESEDEAGPAAEPKRQTFSSLPVPAQFDGMPNTRWWRFEDGRINFGDINMERVDIGRMLMIEFALVFANDWYLLPVETPVGSLSDVRGLVITNSFGERIWVEPAGRGTNHGWRHSRLFAMSGAGGGDSQPLDHGLMIPNGAVAIMDGAPLEEVVLTRDEMSNLVWGVERTITLPHGEPRPGAEASAEMLAYQRRWFPAAAPVEWQAALRYELMNQVPEHWIPFVPTHVPGQQRAVRLQRAVMLRAIEGDPLGVQKVRPRSRLLREGLDEAKSYFLFEEEVPRAGIRVIKAFRRTRARNGRVVTWLAATKRTGRGESSSGLAFDAIKPVT